jgi:hypothetical protein
MSCENWRKQVALYLEGDVSGRKSNQVEKHLDICPACRRFAHELSQSQAVLKSLGHEAIDGKVFQAIQDRVIGELASGKAAASQRWWPSIAWNWGWTGVVTLGLLLLLGGLAFWRPFRETQPVSNNRLAGPPALPEKNSNGPTATEVRNRAAASSREFAGAQTVIEKAGTVQKHRLGKTLRKPRDRSAESTVSTAEKPSSEDGRPVGPQPGEGKASLEVAQVGSQEVKTGINPEAAMPEPLVIKLVTDDPEIVIVWLVDQNGGLRK